jgi:hypothetical protein
MLPERANYFERTKEHFDPKLEKLEDAIGNQSLATSDLAKAVNHLSSSIEDFKSLWGKAIPIQLVYYIIAVMVAGQAAIAAIKYFLPLP